MLIRRGTSSPASANIDLDLAVASLRTGFISVVEFCFQLRRLGLTNDAIARLLEKMETA